MASTPSLNVIRKPVVLQRVGVSKSSLDNMIRDGLFPAPIKTGVRTVGWIEAEVDKYFADLIAARDAKVAANRVKPSASIVDIDVKQAV